MSMCIWHDWLLGTWGSILGTDPGFKNMSVPQEKPKRHGDEKTGLSYALPIPCSLSTVKSLREVLKEQESVPWRLLDVAPTSCGIILFYFYTVIMYYSHRFNEELIGQQWGRKMLGKNIKLRGWWEEGHRQQESPMRCRGSRRWTHHAEKKIPPCGRA